MGELVKNEPAGVISILGAKAAGLDLPVPFSREIYLFDTHVAGTSYIENLDQLEPSLTSSQKLNFFREPQNPYDSKAIVIRTEEGSKIGYVPRSDNLIFSRLMDAGKLLFGRITSTEKSGQWLKIYIKVFLQD